MADQPRATVTLGNHTNKVWLAGFDAGITGQPPCCCPYTRGPQKAA